MLPYVSVNISAFCEQQGGPSKRGAARSGRRSHWSTVIAYNSLHLAALRPDTAKDALDQGPLKGTL